MFERYTEKARRIIFFARYEASQTGSHIIETEHLLLGLLHEAKPLLDGTNVDEMVDELRKAVHVEGAPKLSTSVDLPISQSGQRVLASSAEEAERLHHRHIGPEHLLLALLREPGQAASILEKHGIQRDQIVEKLKRESAADADAWHAVKRLREALAPLAERLTPEVELAIVYSPRSEVLS